MALFYFVRHGEATWNAQERLCGSSDVPLSEVGRTQARELAAHLRSVLVEALYSSPLQRALETARLIGEVLRLTPIVDQRLTELNYGGWEGKTFEEIERAAPDVYQTWDADPANLAPPGGESGVQLIQRVTPFLADMTRWHPQGNVVVVCHKTVCRLLACHIMGVPLKEYRQRVHMENTAINIFEWVEGAWRVLALNDTSYLSPTEEVSSLRNEGKQAR
jgi:broad specificity phosphatase PhoE